MKKMSKLLPPLAILVFASSCAMLDRRDFQEQMEAPFDEPMFIPSRDFPVAQGDEGRAFLEAEEIRGRAPDTASQRRDRAYQHSIQNELAWLESRLNETDYQLYMGLKGQLGSDYEKIYYLRLHPREKEMYLEARNINPPQAAHSGKLVNNPYPASFNGQIAMDMGREQVLNSLGQPDRRDFAGDPASGNERWAYSLNGRTRFIYFEAGQVAGWVEQ